MANPTSNFGWQMPTNTDLVKDLPADFEVFGQAVDTSLMDLKGGTTGQVLSKASNTDMDFTWVAQDDSDAIQNSIVDAKGDLISATGNDVPARLAVGNNGETLVADSSASTGLRWQGNFAAGKNKFLNADFNINQRNFTTDSSNAGSEVYTFDRWAINCYLGSQTTTPQTFTPGTAPVAGYEGRQYFRIVTSSQAAGGYALMGQKIEDVRTFAGQTVTISFWARANSGTPKIAVTARQNFGSGGSPSSSVDTNAGTVTLSTSWARYSLTFAIPSISGKTIGTTGNSSFCQLWLCVSSDNGYSFAQGIGLQNNTFDIWGVQVEAGNTATAFQTATGTLAGELAACQRYYYRTGVGNGSITPTAYEPLGYGSFSSTTVFSGQVEFPVSMRVATGTVDFSNVAINDTASVIAATNVTVNQGGTKISNINLTVASGGTQYRFGRIVNNNNTAGYLAWSAEL